MVVIAERNETKRLEHAARRAAYRAEHFRHSVHVAGVRLKSQFNKVAVGQGARQVQQAAGDRNHLQLALRSHAVSELDDGWRGCELNASSAMECIDLGIVGHAATTIASAEACDEIT